MLALGIPDDSSSLELRFGDRLRLGVRQNKTPFRASGGLPPGCFGTPSTPR
jgi:hypothetical protein